MYSPFVLYRAVSPNHYCNYLGKNTYSCYNTIRLHQSLQLPVSKIEKRERGEKKVRFYIYITNFTVKIKRSSLIYSIHSIVLYLLYYTTNPRIAMQIFQNNKIRFQSTRPGTHCSRRLGTGRIGNDFRLTCVRKGHVRATGTRDTHLIANRSRSS